MVIIVPPETRVEVNGVHDWSGLRLAGFTAIRRS
jgi:hypothetical protein